MLGEKKAREKVVKGGGEEGKPGWGGEAGERRERWGYTIGGDILYDRVYISR